MNPTFKFLVVTFLFIGTLCSCGSSSGGDGPYERKMKNRKYEKQLVKYFNDWHARYGGPNLRYKACIIESEEFQYDREYGNIVSRWLSVKMLGKNKKSGECQYDVFTVEQDKTPDGWSKEWRRRSSYTSETIPCKIVNQYK